MKIKFNTKYQLLLEELSGSDFSPNDVEKVAKFLGLTIHDNPIRWLSHIAIVFDLKCERIKKELNHRQHKNYLYRLACGFNPVLGATTAMVATGNNNPGNELINPSPTTAMVATGNNNPGNELINPSDSNAVIVEKNDQDELINSRDTIREHLTESTADFFNKEFFLADNKDVRSAWRNFSEFYYKNKWEGTPLLANELQILEFLKKNDKYNTARSRLIAIKRIFNLNKKTFPGDTLLKEFLIQIKNQQ